MGRFDDRWRVGGGLGMVSQWGSPSDIVSIQTGTIAIAGASATNTATITAVDPTRSRLVFLGSSIEVGAGESDAFVGLSFTNATTITATRIGTSFINTTQYLVIQYKPGSFRSIQRGTINIGAAAATNTATISAVNILRYSLECLGFYPNTGAVGSEHARLALTNATTITATRIGVDADVTVGYQIQEGW